MALGKIGDGGAEGNFPVFGIDFFDAFNLIKVVTRHGLVVDKFNKIFGEEGLESKSLVMFKGGNNAIVRYF